MRTKLNGLLFLMGFIAVISLITAGCGGGGSGGGGTTADLGGGVDSWRMTANGFIEEPPAGQGAPVLEAPDREEAPVIAGVGYSVRAINAATGQTMATATSDNSGHWSLSFAIPKGADMTVILVALKETITLRAILPLKAQELADLASQSKYNLTLAVPISLATENRVKEIEKLLTITEGNLGKAVTLKTGVTVVSLNDSAVASGFVLTPEGIFNFTGDVDAPPPTFSVTAAGTPPYNAAFGAAVTLKGTVTALTGSLTGRNLTYQWTKTAGQNVTITDSDKVTATFTTKSLAESMAFNQTYLDTNFPGTNARPDRFGIVPLTAQDNSNFSYTLKLTVTDADSGNKAEGSVTIYTLPKQPGLGNVAVGLPILLNAPTAGSYDWVLSLPAGSAAVLTDPTTKNPYFKPDVAGSYEVTERISGKALTIYAGTWTGIKADANGIMTSGNNGCLTCHNGTIARNLGMLFTEWGETPHAHLFREELNTTTGYHYSNSCPTCHTVGNEAAANNGGFDDVAASVGYSIPPAPNTNDHAFQDLVGKYPKLAALGAIECENCHGPSNSEGHGAGEAARVSMDSSVCTVCHGKPSNHNRGQLWAQSGHAQLTSSSVVISNSCARCHTGQGHLFWLKQAQAGKPGPVLDPGTNLGATSTFLASIGSGADTAVPQTCQTCHDPHSEANPNHLRVYGDTFMLPAGFQATNVGKGALCMSCHNTRNGIARYYLKADGSTTTSTTGAVSFKEDVPWLHNSTDPLPALTTLSTGAPHAPSQTDILMGKNGYFVDTTVNYRSPHATTVLPENAVALKAMPDTCVTCHMDLVPATSTGSGTNHKFKIAAADVCYKCHGEGMTAVPRQTETEELLESLAAKIEAGALATINKQTTLNPPQTQIKLTAYLFDANGAELGQTSSIAVDIAKIASLEFTEPHGQQGFWVTFTQNMDFTTTTGTAVNTNRVEVQLGTFKDMSDAVLFPPATDNIIKAGWNYFLV
ncbi:MAG: hypothetical protein HY665_00275, partial [Chloroflexi bacterium]|nr:hypothetical protein [Chloroflexota bacterium]